MLSVPRLAHSDHSSSSSAVGSTAASTSSSSAVAARADAPPVNATVRGSRNFAASATTDETAKREALEDLVTDYVARSNVRPRETQQTTWEYFHMKWFGPQVPVLPLTVEKIQGVAAQFKRGRYRSFSNYFYRAKDEHEEKQYEWTRQLARAEKN